MNEILESIKLITDVSKYVKKHNDIDGKRINYTFEKNINLGGGEITIIIDYHNIPPHQLMNSLDKLQDISNELMKEIPRTIITED